MLTDWDFNDPMRKLTLFASSLVIMRVSSIYYSKLSLKTFCCHHTCFSTPTALFKTQSRIVLFEAVLFHFKKQLYIRQKHWTKDILYLLLKCVSWAPYSLTDHMGQLNTSVKCDLKMEVVHLHCKYWSKTGFNYFSLISKLPWDYFLSVNHTFQYSTCI